MGDEAQTERRSAVRLTPAEHRVLERVALGETNKEVAHSLGCSPRTVEFHLAHIFEKTGIECRTRLISVIAIRSARRRAAARVDRAVEGHHFLDDAKAASCAVPAARLTKAEVRVLKRVLLGATNKEIAVQLNCSAKTVEFHLGHIFRKTGVDSRTRLISGYRRLARITV